MKSVRLESKMLEKVRLESKMKPKLRAESLGVIGAFRGREREGLEFLDVCCRRPMDINAVLDGLRYRRLESFKMRCRKLYLGVDLLR